MGRLHIVWLPGGTRQVTVPRWPSAGIEWELPSITGAESPKFDTYELGQRGYVVVRDTIYAREGAALPEWV